MYRMAENKHKRHKKKAKKSAKKDETVKRKRSSNANPLRASTVLKQALRVQASKPFVPEVSRMVICLEY